MDAVPTGDAYWHVFSTVRGTVDLVHRLDLSGNLGGLHEGTAITMCGTFGRVIYTLPVGTPAMLCPECSKRRPNRQPS